MGGVTGQYETPADKLDNYVTPEFESPTRRLSPSRGNIPNGAAANRLERPPRSTGGGQTLSPDMARGQKSVSPAIELVGRVLRDQGMGMSPAEFEAAAAALLAAENEGAFRLPARDFSISESLVTSSEALTLTPEPGSVLTPTPESPPVPQPRRKK